MSRGDAGWRYRLSTADESNLADSDWMHGAEKRLKIRWSQGRVGSTPSSGTNFFSLFVGVFEI
jgi:hypothetical protein